MQKSEKSPGMKVTAAMAILAMMMMAMLAATPLAAAETNDTNTTTSIWDTGEIFGMPVITFLLILIGLVSIVLFGVYMRHPYGIIAAIIMFILAAVTYYS